MTIRVRPHHLLCMLTFVGKGYTPAFIENFEEIARRIAAGNEKVEVVEGPDDICSAYLTDKNCHCHNASVAERDRLAKEALANLLQQPVQPGQAVLLTSDTLHKMRTAFVAGTIRTACNGCQWKSLCDEMAQNDFLGTRLLNH